MGPIDPGFGGGCAPCGHGHHGHHGHHVSPFGGPNVSPFDQTYHHSTEYWINVSPFGPNIDQTLVECLKSNDMLELAKC